MIHAVDSLKLLRILDEAARSLAAPPAVCLQVNTSGEPSKHGWDAGGDPGRRRVDRGLPVDPGRRPDDDGRAGDDRRDGPGLVRRAPRAARAHCGSGRACPWTSYRWGCRTTSRRPSRKARRWSGSARRCSRGSSDDRDRSRSSPTRTARSCRSWRSPARRNAVLGERAGALARRRDGAARQGEGQRGDPGGARRGLGCKARRSPCSPAPPRGRSGS